MQGLCLQLLNISLTETVITESSLEGSAMAVLPHTPRSAVTTLLALCFNILGISSFKGKKMNTKTVIIIVSSSILKKLAEALLKD